MTGVAQFGLAALGGLVAGFVVYVLPDLIRLAEDRKYVFDWGALWRKIPATAALALIAGLLAAAAFHVPSNRAFYWGLGMQAAIKGIWASVADITKPR